MTQVNATDLLLHVIRQLEMKILHLKNCNLPELSTTPRIHKTHFTGGKSDFESLPPKVIK